MIQDAAAKCRYCGEWLDPSKRPDWAQSAESEPTAVPAPAAGDEGLAATPVEGHQPPPGAGIEAGIEASMTTTDGSVHRPRRRATQTWSAPAWMAPEDREAQKRGASPAQVASQVAPQPEQPETQLHVATPQQPEPAAEPSIDDVAERMRRIKASAAAVREAMLSEAASLQADVLPAEAQPRPASAQDASDSAITMHAGATPAAEPPPSDEVAAMLADDFADDFADDDDDDLGGDDVEGEDDRDDLDDRADALPGKALDGFDFGDDFDDDDDDDDFDGDFGDVGASRPIPWKPVAIAAGVVFMLGAVFFWDRIFPSETLQQAPAGEEANAEDGADEGKAAPEGQVAQGSVAPPAPGQGQPVVPEGSQPAAVGVAPAADPAGTPADPAMAAVPADPNAPAVPADPNAPAVPADPNAPAVPADPNAPVANPAAPVVPAAALPADAAAGLDEARGLYQKGGKRRLGEAKETLQGILAATPNSADALLLMAQVQLELGETEDSLKTATQCTAVAPQTADCWLTIGALKQNDKDKEAAAAAYERYLALAPEGAYASQVKKQIKRLK